MFYSEGNSRAFNVVSSLSTARIAKLGYNEIKIDAIIFDKIREEIH